MPTLTLPQLVAGRELAAAAVARLGALTDTDVVVDARALASGTSSFAAQLVRSIVVDGQAATLTVVGGPAEFVRDVRAAADSLTAAGRVMLTDDLPLPAAS